MAVRVSQRKYFAVISQDTEIRTYEEKIHHLAEQMISIDLDDGVKKNYAMFQDVLAKIKQGGLEYDEGRKNQKFQ